MSLWTLIASLVAEIDSDGLVLTRLHIFGILNTAHDAWFLCNGVQGL